MCADYATLDFVPGRHRATGARWTHRGRRGEGREDDNTLATCFILITNRPFKLFNQMRGIPVILNCLRQLWTNANNRTWPKMIYDYSSISSCLL